MSSLQIALVVAGVLLVVGVIVYNRWQERRARERLGIPRSDERSVAPENRMEPTLRLDDEAVEVGATAEAESAEASTSGTGVSADTDFRAPMDAVVRLPADEVAPAAEGGTDAPLDDFPADETAVADTGRRTRAGIPAQLTAAAPDADIETIISVQPVRSVAASALTAGLHARLGKPVRWYGRREPRGPWQRLSTDSRGEYGEFAACMLLADRNGPATLAQVQAFRKLVADLAASLPAASNGAAPEDEVRRAEALDRLCAELDMQIGLTVRKAPPAIIAGTRLRGVAEASGFRLAPTGRFEYVQDDTGAVIFTLQNITDEAFTPESLRTGATPGVIFLLDVPRVADPARAFDQMKIAAKRMAQTVGGELVDDNGRPLNDAGLAKIRDEVAAAEAALRNYNIEPGSPRALKLFAA